MGTVIVDNKNIRELFEKILKNEHSIEKKKIIISAESGKGKTSILMYFCEKCNQYKIPCIYFDFKILNFNSELDLIDNIIYQLKLFNNSLNFTEYEKCLEKYYNASKKSTIFSGIKVIKSEIRNITLPESYSKHLIASATSAFWDDFKRLIGKQKVIMLFDTYEKAGYTIQDWFKKYIFFNKLKSNKLFIVIAGQNIDTLINPKYAQIFSLPNKYPLEDWLKFGEEIHINDKATIDQCFKFYDGEPFQMCIALKPHGGINE